MDSIEMVDLFKKLIGDLVEKRQVTAAKAVLQGAMLVVDSPSSRNALSELVGSTSAGAFASIGSVSGKTYGKLQMGGTAAQSAQKKTLAGLSRQVERRVLGNVAADSINTSSNFTPLAEEKPYAPIEELEYENGGEFEDGGVSEPVSEPVDAEIGELSGDNELKQAVRGVKSRGGKKGIS